MTKKIFKGSAMLSPVPSVLITSKNENKINVFTAAWVGMACTKPPMVTVAIRPERLSYEFIKKSGEFVINLPTKSMAKIVDYCGVVSGRDHDKIKEMSLSLEECSSVSVPMIGECPICLECNVKNIIKLGSHDLFLSEIAAVDVDESIIDKKGKIHFEKANLISYCHGNYFSLQPKSLGKFGFSVNKHKK